LMGQSCPTCGGTKKLTTETFIEKAKAIHGDKCSYDKVEYVNHATKVIITCPEHGDFEQTPNSHLDGKGCLACSGRKQLTTETFIEKAKAIHGDKYSYDKVEYEKIYDKVMLTCPEHGDFEQVAHDHLRRNGCGKCINKAEGKIAIHLNERFITHRQHRVGDRFFDFYLPEYNLLIERDGEQHYQIVGHWVTGEDEEYVENQQANDQHKTDLAKEHGYKIARIPYWLTDEEVELELDNILKGQPTYPDVPDLEQAKTQPKPYNFGGSEV
jgi:very-short-patch-repair endonuclease